MGAYISALPMLICVQATQSALEAELTFTRWQLETSLHP